MTAVKSMPYPLLLTDCSAPGVRVGILDKSGWLAYTSRNGEAVAALFEAVETVLAQTGLALEDLGGFAYCEGPGSTLGIRINLMALKTWNSLYAHPRPVFAYQSLQAAALIIRSTSLAQSDFVIFSDLRKGVWNACKVDDAGMISPIEAVDRTALDGWSGRRFYLRQRLYSPGPPPEAQSLEYDLKPLGTSREFLKLFAAVEEPGVFQTTITEFKRWEPQRHR